MTVPESDFPQRFRSPLIVTWERNGRIRRVRLDPRISLAIGAGLVVVGLWALAMTLYVVFRDDLATSLVTRQEQAREAYEDRISSLRSTIDRLTSRQMVEQASVADRLTQLAARQAALEMRQAVVSALAGAAAPVSAVQVSAAGKPDRKVPALAASGSVEAGVGGPLPETALSYAPLDAGPRSGPSTKPRVLGEKEQPGLFLRRADDELRPPERTSALEEPRGSSADLVQSLAARLDAAEGGQLSLLSDIESRARRRIERARSVLSHAGLDQSRFAAASDLTAAGQGGPLVPLPQGLDGGTFGDLAGRAEKAILDARRMAGILDRVPLRRPLAGEADLSSGFGARIDPFTHGVALHTGLDFRDEWGAPVRATAPGRVVFADASGGYGNMVEIDHGAGIATRYGHLSAILVSDGQQVEAGTIIGRVGSTGRSTGPHLHYETRIDGEAVDPLRFLRAGGWRAG